MRKNDLALTEDEVRFKNEIRGWLRSNLPGATTQQPTLRLAGGEEARKARREWHRKMYEGGWVGIDWPPEFGGRGATIRQKVVFNQELERAGAPEIAGWMGVEFVGRTLINFGTPELKEEFLEPILRGEIDWAMGYSEPDAGSDLASLKCRAELDGDDFVVNGIKLWNHAKPDSWMFTLVRTDDSAPKHKGISYILINMRWPGVTIRELASLAAPDGFSEVVFENVRVPRRYLVGELNEGWRVAMATLAYDRATQGATVGIANMMNAFGTSMRVNAEVLSHSDVNRHRVAQRFIEIEISHALDDRNVSLLMSGEAPAAEGSQSKMFYSELEQRCAVDMMNVLGMYGVLAQGSSRAVDDGLWALEFLWSKALTIAGGSSEVLRNTIAQRMLGLPRA